MLMEGSQLQSKRLLELIYIIFLFFITSFLFHPLMVSNLWRISQVDLLLALKVILTGLIAVGCSTFILAPIIFRGIEQVQDKDIHTILRKVTDQSQVKKIPGICRVRTSQANAIAYFVFNRSCIGLTNGLLEAYHNRDLNDQDLESIFACLLYYFKSGTTIKRNFMYSIASLYNSMCYILLFSGRGFFRLAKITEQRGSGFLIRMTGMICMIIGLLFRIPEKISSCIASPLIYRFQKDADKFAERLTGPKGMQRVIQKVIEYNRKLNKELSVLPDPEYWFVEPVRLLKMDQLVLFRIPFQNRINSFF